MESFDASLVTSAVGSRDEVLKDLYEKHDPHLRQFIPKFLRVKGCHSPDSHCDGVRSQSWISVLSRLDDLRNPDSFRAWMTVIATNAARKHLRDCIKSQLNFDPIEFDGGRGLGLDEVAEISSGQRVIDAAIDAARVLQVANRISSEFAEILYLRFGEDLDFHEIAQVLKMPLSSVRTIYYRYRPRLYDVLTPRARLTRMK